MVDVRAAALDDWPNVEPLLEEMGFVEMRDRIRERFETVLQDAAQLFAVATRGDAIVGYVWAQDLGPHLRSGRTTVRMHDIFVLPADRRSGIGRSLFNAVRRWAAARGASWLQWNGGSESREFYARIGVEPTAEDPNHPFYELDLKRRAE